MEATGDGAARERWRQITTYRAGIVALVAAVLLITPVGEPGNGTAVWFSVLFVLAAIGSFGHWVLRAEHPNWALIGETVAVGLVSAAAQSAGAPWVALYIVVPAMWAGSTLPLAKALPIGLLPSMMLFAAGAATGGTSGGAYAQWWILSLSVTVIAVLLARIEARRAKPDYYYDRALPLLKQLAPIARRLPLGLERKTLLDNCVTEVQALAPSCDLLVAAPADAGWFVEYQTLDAVGLQQELPTLADAQQLRAATVLRRDRATGVSIAAVPVRRADSLHAVLLIAARTRALTRDVLEQVQSAASLLAVQLEASAVFESIREDATAEERSRLSRQIHDGVAQDLAGLAYSLDAIAGEQEDAEQSAAVDEAAQEVRRLVDELRYSIFDLRTRPSRTDSFGTAVANYAREVGDRSGLRVILELDDSAGQVPPAAAAELFRILQESVTNARKHAGATALRIVTRVTDEEVFLQVSDNGTGLRDPEGRLSAGEGVGLTVMRERADRLGAAFALESDAGGTVVECRLGIGSPGRAIASEPATGVSVVRPSNPVVRLARGAWRTAA